MMNMVIKSKTIKRVFLNKQLLKESAIVATDSMVVLREFEKFEEDLSSDESDDAQTPHLRLGRSHQT
jgi:hypothetical protein